MNKKFSIINLFPWLKQRIISFLRCRRIVFYAALLSLLLSAGGCEFTKNNRYQKIYSEYENIWMEAIEKEFIDPIELWNKQEFFKLFKPYYIDWKNDIYEIKNGEKGISVYKDKIILTNRNKNGAMLVRRNVFNSSESWILTIDFKINNFFTPENPIHEPLFITFSDNLNAGFLVIWPDLLQYFSLGPSVHFVKECRLQNISNKLVKMVIQKKEIGILEIIVDKSKFEIDDMGGDTISTYNYEIPPYIRFTPLNKLNHPFEKKIKNSIPLDLARYGNKNATLLFNKSLTRNFLRFGTIYYSDYPAAIVDLEVLNLSVNSGEK